MTLRKLQPGALSGQRQEWMLARGHPGGALPLTICDDALFGGFLEVSMELSYLGFFLACSCVVVL